MSSKVKLVKYCDLKDGYYFRRFGRVYFKVDNSRSIDMRQYNKREYESGFKCDAIFALHNLVEPLYPGNPLHELGEIL